MFHYRPLPMPAFLSLPHTRTQVPNNVETNLLETEREWLGQGAQGGLWTSACRYGVLCGRTGRMKPPPASAVDVITVTRGDGVCDAWVKRVPAGSRLCRASTYLTVVVHPGKQADRQVAEVAGIIDNVPRQRNAKRNLLYFHGERALWKCFPVTPFLFIQSFYLVRERNDCAPLETDRKTRLDQARPG